MRGVKGKISAGIFKVMAVVSALAIGGGYVAWRQAEARKDMAEQTDAKVKRERERLLREMDEAWQADAKEIELMVGSKNPGRPVIGKEMTKEEIDAYLEKGKDFILPIPGIPQGAEEVSNVTPLLPGSKSISMPLFTKRHITKGLEMYDGYTVEVLPPPEDEKKLPELLPGSKSGTFIPEEPEPEKSE